MHCSTGEMSFSFNKCGDLMMGKQFSKEGGVNTLHPQNGTLLLIMAGSVCVCLAPAAAAARCPCPQRESLRPAWSRPVPGNGVKSVNSSLDQARDQDRSLVDV